MIRVITPYDVIRPRLSRSCATIQQEINGCCLIAPIWCLLTSEDYRKTVLKAVNLGDDTDTTGNAAGGLAGVHAGLASVPQNWRKRRARAGDLTEAFEHFAAS